MSKPASPQSPVAKPVVFNLKAYKSLLFFTACTPGLMNIIDAIYPKINADYLYYLIKFLYNY
ncbi:MAG: hypothetical protein CL609_16140 [Anaerolineaceae bacterium]|nr:hypothetical protein [Anaerolineaceae bacterium]